MTETERPEDLPAPLAAAEEEEAEDFAAFDLSKKKKKKKKKVVEDEEDDGGDDAGEDEDGNDGDDVAEDFEASLSLKKKKKKKKPMPELDEDVDVEDEDEDEEDIGSSSAGPTSWSGSDRDYTYEELLERVFDRLQKKNPELYGRGKRFVVKPPQVMREGSKKTVFANFKEICDLLHRSTEHVQAFMLAEMGTQGSLDGSNRMVIKGRFVPKQVESLLRKYIREYVTCKMCGSADTVLFKDRARLMMMKCEIGKRKKK